MSTIDEIMACADRFAAESIEYNKHPHVKLEGMRDAARYNLKFMVRDELAQRDEEIAKLRARLYILAAALAEARREGAEAMRAEVQAKLQALHPVAWVRYGSDGRIDGPLLDAQVDGARRKCWTPLVAADFADLDRRQAVLLTDDDVWKSDAIMSANEAAGLPMFQLMLLVHAIQAAALAANGLEVRRG